MQSVISYITHLPKLALECGALKPLGVCEEGLTLEQVIALIANYLIGFIGGVLAIVILISAIQFVTSAGSPDRIKSAKDRMIQAAVSLGLLISFRAILGLFQTLFKGAESASQLSDVSIVINNAVAILLFAVGALSVIFVIVGAIQYITAGGGEGTAKAKKTITYAVGGLVLSLSIGAIIALVNSLFFSGN